MGRRRKVKAPSLSCVRSAITNGNTILAGNVDHRSTWMRRLRDLQQAHLSDAGGFDNVSEAEKSLIRRASMLELQLEMMDAKFAANDGEASLPQLQAYQSACNTLRRTLEAVGLQRRPKEVSKPSLTQYLQQRQINEAAE
jgi:hypothetical protein